MIQIISDKKLQKYIFDCSKIDIKDEQISPINKETKNISIDINPKNNYYWDEEKKYTEELCEKISVNDVFIRTSFGITKKINTTGEFNKKFCGGKNLTFRFDDKLQFIMSGKKIAIEDFKKICKLKKVKIECEFNFYSVVYKTQEKTNITNKLKLTKIKVLEISGEEKQIKNYKSYDSLCEIKNYTTKKEAVTNIMKLLAKQT